MDAIDNSAGVDCSDHEVNIKILLDTIVADGDLTGKQRNADPRRDGGRGGRSRPARQLRADAGDLELDGAGGVDGRGARALRPEPRAGRHAEPRARVPADRRGIRRAPGSRRRADPARVRDPALAHEDRARRRSCSPPTCRRTRTSRASSSATSRRVSARSSRRSCSATRCGARSSPRGSSTTSSTAPGRRSPSGWATRPAPAPTTSRAPTPWRARSSGCAASGREIEGARRARARGDADRDAAQGAHPARASDALAPAQPPQAARHRGDRRPLRPGRRPLLPRRCPRCSARPSVEAAQVKAAGLVEIGVPPELAQRVAHLEALVPTFELVEIAAAAEVEVVGGGGGLLRARRAARAALAARPHRRPSRETRWEAMARAALRDDVYSEQASLTAAVLRVGTGARALAGRERRRDRAVAAGACRHQGRRRPRSRPAVGGGARDPQPDPLERNARAGCRARVPAVESGTRSRDPRVRARGSRSPPRCRSHSARLASIFTGHALRSSQRSTGCRCSSSRVIATLRRCDLSRPAPTSTTRRGRCGPATPRFSVTFAYAARPGSLRAVVDSVSALPVLDHFDLTGGNLRPR